MVDDGIARTWQEAREFCYEEYGSDLAALNQHTIDECFQSAIADISPDISYWTGIYSPNRYENVRPYCYEFADGECPERHTCACVAPDSWLNNEPLPCTQGSQCARYLPEEERIVNDIDCGEPLLGVICNVPLLQIRSWFFCAKKCKKGWAFKRCSPPEFAVCDCDSRGNPVGWCSSF